MLNLRSIYLQQNALNFTLNKYSGSNGSMNCHDKKKKLDGIESL